MARKTHPTWNPGDEILADDLNELSRGTRTLDALTVGKGLRIYRSPQGGVVIALDNPPPRPVDNTRRVKILEDRGTNGRYRGQLMPETRGDLQLSTDTREISQQFDLLHVDGTFDCIVWDISQAVVSLGSSAVNKPLVGLVTTGRFVATSSDGYPIIEIPPPGIVQMRIKSDYTYMQGAFVPEPTEDQWVNLIQLKPGCQTLP